MDKIFHIGATFTKSVGEDDELYIEGMASTSTMDRIGDIIASDAWTKAGGLDNFLKNPVILFNHNYNKPIGKAASIEATDQGLRLRAKIADSAEENIKGLIKEGVLGAFSVGFRVKDAEYMSESDGYLIKEAELLEVSVVTIPMNQNALFSIAKSFDSVKEYKDFLKSFKTDSLSETSKDSNTDGRTDLLVKEQENTMDQAQIEALVAAAVEKTAAAMALKEDERRALEKVALEASVKAAAEAATNKTAIEDRINLAVKTGAEKLMEDVAAKMAAKDADHAKIIAEMSGDLTEKAAEIQKIRDSKRQFSDRNGNSKSFEEINEQEICDAHLIGILTQKGWNTKAGKALMEKAVNADGGVAVPTSTQENFETIVSTSLERDIELELVLDRMFRKIQMNAATMVIPTMPDSGFADFLAAGSTPGSGSVNLYKGNLEARGSTANDGVALGSTILQTNKLVSKSYMSNEVEEDAIMPILSLIRDSMVRAHARSVDHSLLLGGHADSLVSNSYKGLIQLATDRSDVLDLGSPAQGITTITTAMLLNMRQQMGKYGKRPSDVVYIVSLKAYYDLLDDPEFQDVNLVGSDRASKLTGEIGQAYGSAIIVSDDFPDMASGKAFAVALNARNFVVPTLRGMTVEQDYSVEGQHRVLVATQRRGFQSLFATAGQVIVSTY